MKNTIYIAVYIFLTFSFLLAGGETISEICWSSLGERNGAVLLADARTGELIAAVGNHDILSGEKFFPPGSVFKIITTIAALEAGFQPDERIRCVYWYNAPGGKLHCSWSPGHGIVDMKRAVSISCSFYFYHLVDCGITPVQIKHIAHIFGFDDSPFDGISPVHWTKMSGLNAPYLFAIGLRGVEVSPYHILRMMLCVANRGAIPSADGIVTDEVSNISSNSWDFIISALRSATADGIAHGAAPDGIPVAGKTGTAPIPDAPDITCGWFAGFIPYDMPRYVIVVLVSGGTGFTDAAPIAGKILKKIYYDVQKAEWNEQTIPPFANDIDSIFSSP